MLSVNMENGTAMTINQMGDDALSTLHKQVMNEYERREEEARRKARPEPHDVELQDIIEECEACMDKVESGAIIYLDGFDSHAFFVRIMRLVYDPEVFEEWVIPTMLKHQGK